MPRPRRKQTVEAPVVDPKHDVRHVERFCAGIRAVAGRKLSNAEEQDLSVVAVRMSAYDREKLIALINGAP